MLIRSGAGRIDWTDAHHDLEAGQGMLLLPGQWHRYCPKPETGWCEDWIELRGPMMERWIAESLFEKNVFTIPPVALQRMDELHRLAHKKQRDSGELAAVAMALLAAVAGKQADPNDTSSLSVQRHDKVDAARKLLKEGLSVSQTAQQIGVSYPTLNRIFKESVGLSPKTYARQQRLARAEALLASGGLSVKEIALEPGYRSASHFSADFKSEYNKAPLHWLKSLHHSNG